MPNETYNLIDEKHCLHEGMTREQIINAIAEATGVTPQNVDDGFISTVVETNRGSSIHIWKGTASEYAALETHDANTLYVITDDMALEDIQAAIDNTNGTIGTLQENVGTVQSDLSALDGRVTTAENDIDTAEGNIGTLQTDVGTLQNDVSSLGGRMTDAESGISNINGKIGAQNGIASLDANTRIPVTQMPKHGWTSDTIAASSITTSGYTYNISFARALLIITCNQAAYYAHYEKASASLYGIRKYVLDRTVGAVTFEDTVVGMGDVTGDIRTKHDESASLNLTATSSGLKFKLLSGGTAREVTILIRQEA